MKDLLRQLARTTHLTAMHKVLRQIRRQGLDPSSMDALEIFGCDGEHHTRELAAAVATLDIWEYQPVYEEILRDRFPKANVKITDSYDEIKRTTKTYDLVVDNSDYTPTHFEHFDLFPAVFRALRRRAVLVVNILPQAPTESPEHLSQRQEFYEAGDPRNITFAEMTRAYQSWSDNSGLTLGWQFFVRRWTFGELLGWFGSRGVPGFYAVLYFEAKCKFEDEAGQE